MFTVFYCKPIETVFYTTFETLDEAKAFIENEAKGCEIAEEIADDDTYPYYWYEIVKGEPFENFSTPIYQSPVYWGRD